MSALVQAGRKHAGKKAAKKSVGKKRPTWDSTTSDLTVYKLSREEQKLRHCRIQSKNAEKAKKELEESAREGRQLNSTGNPRLTTTKKSGPLHEKELHNVLAESDRAIAVVKDLFGDDPKRYTGQPNVTVAPHVATDKAALQRTLLEGQWDGPAPSADNSPGGIRDGSVLALAPVKPALNDLPSPSSDFSIDESGLEDSTLQSPEDHSPPPPPHSTYHPTLDLHRFQKLVKEAEAERGGGEAAKGTQESTEHGTSHNTRGEGVPNALETSQLSSILRTGTEKGNVTVDSQAPIDVSTRAGVPTEVTVGERSTVSTSSASTQTSVQPLQDQSLTTPLTHKPHPLQIAHKMPPRRTYLAQSSSVSSTDRGPPQGRARKVSPTKTRENSKRSNKSIHDDLSVLQKLVLNLEQELQDFEQASGYSFPVHKPPTVQAGAFSSLTASLLASVTKLTHYLKQSQIQLKGEVAVRSQLLHAMTEQQNLMDALTADVVKVQQENSSLRSSIQQLQEETSQQMQKLEESMQELCIKMTHLEQPKVVSLAPHPQDTSSEQETANSITESSPPAGTVVASVVSTATINTPQPALSPHSQSSLPAESLAHPSPSLPQTSFPQTGISGATFLPTSDHLTLPVGGNVVTHPPPPLPGAISSATPAPGVMTSTPLIYPTYSTPSLPSASITPTNPGLLASAYGHLPPTLGTQTPTHVSSAHPPLTIRDNWLSSFPPSLGNSHSLFTTPTASASAVELSPPVVSPSELSLSPPPLSIALHVPSLPFQPSIPKTSTEGLASVPYYWRAPSETLSSSYTTSVPSSTTTVSHYNNTSHSLLPPMSNSAPRTAAALAPPNLSVSLDPSSDAGEKDSVTSSTLDIEASLARMSSLARSVLEELAQDRGQLLQKLEPTPSKEHPNPSSVYSSLPSLSMSNSTPSIVTSHPASTALQPADDSVELNTHEPASSLVMDRSTPTWGQTNTTTYPPTTTDTKGATPPGWFSLASHVTE